VTRLEALAEMAARHELAPPEQQEAIAVLLRELIGRIGPDGVPVRSQEEIVTVPNFGGTRTNKRNE
jgi:hypothetical protein